MTGFGPRARLTLLYLCFFLSGIAGLIYEVAWSRYLALFVGSTGEAHVIILSTYMGGLALGAYLFGRWVDRVADPLALYLRLEIAIGILGAAYPLCFEPIRDLFVWAARAMELAPGGMRLASILAAALTVLVPTTLMGGTLPVLGRYLIRTEESIGRQISNLYYLNSFGAVAGSLVTGFWLIRTVGLHGSMWVGAALNLAVVVLGFALLRSGGISSSPVESSEPAAPAERSPTVARYAIIASVVIGVSGFVSMVYEVAWIRLLTLVLGSSSFSFSVMLAAFIFGIALGSFLLSLKKADGNYFRILGWCEVAIGLTALISIMFYEHLPVILNQLRVGMPQEAEFFARYEFMKFALCFAVMVVPTIFMGATLPAASRVIADGVGTLGRRVGGTFAINTVGTMLGAIVAGFVLLPWIGIRHTIEVAVGANLLLGLTVLLADAPVAARAVLRPAVAVALSVIVPLFYFAKAPSWDQRVFASAVYRLRTPVDSLESLKTRLEKREFIYYKDGTDATIAVARDPISRGEGFNLSLLINGKPDASTDTDMQTQLFIGHLPMLLHPDPKSVLVVGLGSGVSLGATTLYETETLECLELIPEVIEAARFFAPYNNDVLDNPHAKIIRQDAKTHLLVSETKYDVIINEPTNPWIAGVAGLFSTEYFEVAKARINPGGLFVQWFQVYELEDATLDSMIATLQHTFPYATLFNFSGADVAVVASTEPFRPDFARMESILASPNMARSLAKQGIIGPFPVLSMQMMNHAETPSPITQSQRINSDFVPVLEYEASRGFFVGTHALGIRSLDRRGTNDPNARLWIDEFQPVHPPAEGVFESYLPSFKKFGTLGSGAQRHWLDLWAKYYPESSALARARADVHVTSPAPMRDRD
jgi:spermidine synthase